MLWPGRLGGAAHITLVGWLCPEHQHLTPSHDLVTWAITVTIVTSVSCCLIISCLTYLSHFVVQSLKCLAQYTRKTCSYLKETPRLCKTVGHLSFLQKRHFVRLWDARSKTALCINPNNPQTLADPWVLSIQWIPVILALFRFILILVLNVLRDAGHILLTETREKLANRWAQLFLAWVPRDNRISKQFLPTIPNIFKSWMFTPTLTLWCWISGWMRGAGVRW